VFDGVTFDDCLNFLIVEGYLISDFVGSPGEYSARGGIIDVYPFASVGPFRINFLDDIATVFRFDVDTQLTTSEIKNFTLSSVSDNRLSSLNGVCLNQFLPINFYGNNELYVGFGSSPNHQICLDVLTYSRFVGQDRAFFRSISILEGLSSVGILDDKKNLFIPSWFIKSGRTEKAVKQMNVSSLPLQMSKIKRGDFLVHRDHGVGVCLGLSLSGQGTNIQEFLAIKYGDGGVLSIDVGRFLQPAF
jgi:transcription-repair coupling factor (superfamily II helicase)